MRPTVRLSLVLLAFAATGCSFTFGGSPGIVGSSVDVSAFIPSAKNQDPSMKIDGVTVEEFGPARHVRAQQRVAYTHSPPFGGNHDQAWAACNGVVYPGPVRSENLVHSLEHGAVWIAYDPERIDGGALDALTARVEGQPYLMMSPYPDLAQPISLQSWGHQLALTDAGDPRIEQFIAALRQNRYTHPEPGASCAEVGAPTFSQADPPPFVPAPAIGDGNGGTIVPE